MSDDFTLWNLLQIAGAVIMGLLTIGGVMVKKEMERLQSADIALTKAITALTEALSTMRADLPMQYVLKVDLLHIQQSQADEVRAMRSEISGLRHDLNMSISGLRTDITSMIGVMRDKN